ncbi:GtrA-like protein [Legionella steigerwaltii]|uniref:GtrA-like protein n=1 Tax=Legionella steigerwaltii TaxID=460 RepID=A0A378LD62_9GAMM|nr:GtrA family protein [Legionella steigerwaltii]KTD75352.1 GtrA-like protein [Legionella steigerwaltii]STY23709.1 GtrA-like protein [Legionella steigerwaltii]
MIHHFKSKQFIVFLIVGTIAFTVNFCSRIIYNYSFSFSTSILLAYITGMVVAFILVKLFVFKKSQQTVTRSIIFFILVNLIGMLQTWVISLLLAYYVLPALGIQSYTREIAHLFGLASPVFTSYLGHKFWTFRETI